MSGRATRLARAAIAVVGIVVAAALGWFLFVRLPDSLAELLGVLLALAAIVVGARIALRIASSVFPSYNVAEVAVEGPITRSGRGGLRTGPGGASADDIVEQIERADEDGSVKALLVKLNTPGGEVVPSDDIRRAAKAFDGPTVAYATDICASGGYWIASGCDSLWARDASVVGSIGVIGSLVNASELAERLGVSYERFAAGRFKDAGMPLKELTPDERAYIQGMIDDFYDRFVERVTEGRELDAEEVRDTEARVYLGEEAVSIGLVDELGAREEIEDSLEEELEEPVAVEEFEPERGLADRLSLASTRLAYAFGAGIADTVAGDREFSLELR